MDNFDKLMDVVCVKLLSGEVLFGMLESESETEIVLYYPVIVDMSTMKAKSYCPFTDDRIFFLSKKFVMFVKGLDPTIEKRYKKMVERLVNPDVEIEDVEYEEPEELPLKVTIH